jgi:glycerophosphoryl diester phosphodiesterase
VIPRVIAHRGASAAFPENTIEAFRGARSMGADGVELDVRRTADGVLAVHHDAALADGRVIVELTGADLPASVCDLEAALDACAGLDVVNIEIKNWPDDPDFDPELRLADQVVALVDRRGDHRRVLVSCFHLPTVDRVRGLDERMATAWLTFSLPDQHAAIDRAARHGHSAIHPHVAFVDTAYVEHAHDAGLEVNTWTCDDPDRMAELATLGVDGIVTNVPDVARRVLDGRS